MAQAPRDHHARGLEWASAAGLLVIAALDDPGVKGKLADLGNVPLAMTPADFGKLIATETEKRAKVVKFAGIKPK
jgi:hypothetical protein